MRGSAGFIIVAIGLFLLYVAVSDKYPVLARFMREMFDVGAAEGEEEGDGATILKSPPEGDFSGAGGSWEQVRVSDDTPFDMLQRMGIRVSTPPFVGA